MVTENTTHIQAAKKDDNKSYLAAIVGIAGFVFVVGLWLWFWKHESDVASAEALFTGLAFLGVILTVLLQRQELQLQRQELRDTREEIRRQREQMELQNATLLRIHLGYLLELHDSGITKARVCKGNDERHLSTSVPPGSRPL